MTVTRDYLVRHAISLPLAAAVGVRAAGGDTLFPYPATPVTRVRRADGSMRQSPAGQGLWLYWPCGGQRAATHVLLCEGEADTLAAASVLCEGVGEPRGGLPDLLAGLVPVGLPGAATPTRVVCGELLAANTMQVFICMDGDEAGQRASERLCKALSGLGIEAVGVFLPEGKDLSDCLIAADDRAGWLAGTLTESLAVAV